MPANPLTTIAEIREAYRKLYHAVWHLLDDSEDRGYPDEVSVDRSQFDELARLVPEEDHPDLARIPAEPESAKHEDITDAQRSVEDTHRDPLSTSQADRIINLLDELAAWRDARHPLPTPPQPKDSPDA